MEIQRYIGRELSGLKMAMDRTLDSLTQEEISWRPSHWFDSPPHGQVRGQLYPDQGKGRTSDLGV